MINMVSKIHIKNVSTLLDAETDVRFRLTEELLESEREFAVSLRTIHDVYGRPLRKLCSISDEEQKQLFGGVEPVLSVSYMLLNKVSSFYLITYPQSYLANTTTFGHS